MSVDDAKFVTYALRTQRRSREKLYKWQQQWKTTKNCFYLCAANSIRAANTLARTHTEKLSITLYLIDVSWIGQATFWCIIEWWMFMSVADKGKTKHRKKLAHTKQSAMTRDIRAMHTFDFTHTLHMRRWIGTLHSLSISKMKTTKYFRFGMVIGH